MNAVAIQEYEVEIIYLGEPKFIVTINDTDERHAIRRAQHAVWMKQLREDDPWDKDQMEGRIYND